MDKPEFFKKVTENMNDKTNHSKWLCHNISCTHYICPFFNSCVMQTNRKLIFDEISPEYKKFTFDEMSLEVNKFIINEKEKYEFENQTLQTSLKSIGIFPFF